MTPLVTAVGTSVDTNVLLDVLVEGAPHAEESHRALDEAALKGPLEVGPATYGELLVFFQRQAGKSAREELDLFVHETGLRVQAWHPEAAATAGKAYARYLGDRDPGRVECAACGTSNAFRCHACAATVAWRAHLLSDFLIGAQALHTTGVLLTRDRHLHKRISGLRLISP